MAYPQWITPAGNLGIVPSAEYYQYSLDAYDTAGGTLAYARISGSLPPGIQITATGVLQGIPISTAGPDLNQTYIFTIRVTNTSDGLIADRTFQLTITNVAPPQIVPSNPQIEYQLVTLAGDTITANIGDTISQPLSGATTTVILANVVSSQTVGVTYNSSIKFTLNSGNLIVNSTSINSYPTSVQPKTSVVPYDLGIYFDGDIVDLQLEATEYVLGDNLVWTLKSGELPAGISLTSGGLLHGYINEIPQVGPEGDPGWDDTEWDLRYTLANNASGTLGWDFDLGTTSKSFSFTIEVNDGVQADLSTYTLLVLPKTSLSADSTLITADTTRVDGNDLTVDTGTRHKPIIITTQEDFVAQRQGGWYAFKLEAVDLDEDVLQYVIPTLSQGSFDEQSNSSVKPYLEAVVSNGNITVGLVGNTGQPNLVPGDNIQVLVTSTDPISEQQTLAWYDAQVTNYATIQLAGNVKVLGNVGDYISQSISSANATIANISTTVGTLTLGGAQLIGTISVAGALITANVGDFVTQLGSSANATVNFDSSQSSVLSVRFTAGTFTLNSGNLKINGANVAVYPVATSASVQYINFSANVGDYITQPSTGANARVIVPHSGFGVNTANPFDFRIQLTSGNFTTGSGNLRLNGSDVDAYPQNIACTTNITAIYSTLDVFELNVKDSTGLANIAGTSTGSYVGDILAVGVSVAGAPNTQGTIGFDESRFDQGTLAMPGTLTVDINSGWITGYLPGQIPNVADYEFEVQVYKKDYISYSTSKLFTISVLGDLYNEVNWLTPSYLGDIQNGAVSDLYVEALSTQNKSIFYQLTPSVRSNLLTYTRGIAGPYQNIPQGLTVKPSGLISGRVSFELFSLDSGTTTFDTDPLTGFADTTFDQTFEFSVLAETFDQTASATRVFTIRVRERNIQPYENLYLKALLTPYQRIEFRRILQDQSVFPPDLIYRSNDPWFGIAQDVKTLFLPGLAPTLAADYIDAMQTNHFSKRLLFSNIKSAVAKQDGVYDVIETNTSTIVGTYNVYTSVFVPTNFDLGFVVQSGIPSGCIVGDQHVKYEVVYVEVKDENSNSLGQGPANSINLSSVIQNYYFDSQGNSYYIANPNAFSNMDSAITTNIGYANKGALPDWMTSIQPNGTQLGFTRAVVLAYVEPGAGETVAWRLQQRGYKLNEINFTVDRYLLDNVYSTNYDIASNAFITSTETTFDRYPALPAVFNTVATVDYAVDLAFDNINERAVSAVNLLGGLDGVTTYRDGETLIFYTQEYPLSFNVTDNYNQGWTDSLSPWDGFGGSKWDDDKNTTTTTDDLGWDGATYIPGHIEWNSSKDTTNAINLYSTVNQRISIWRITVDSDNYVSLSLANITASVTSVTANTAGFGSNISLRDISGLFVGMPVKGAGLTGNCQVTDIVGNIVTVYPTAVSAVGSTITFIPQPNYNNSIYVRNGFTHGGVNIYYDPIIKTNNTVPNYSEISQEIKTTSTIFDGNGTLFYDYRDTYVVPDQGSKYLVFPRLNVFQ